MFRMLEICVKSCLIGVLLVTCTPEYQITDSNKVSGEANPPQLEKIDRITQITKQEVDVLWVIDNSCSMIEEQTSLVNNFDAFINYFLDSKLDWHIGVTSTDMTPGDIPGNHGTLNMIGDLKFIDENTPNPVQVFSQLASMGTAGSGIEEGVTATYGAIAVHDGCEHNKGFYREDATLSVVVISDEEDYSTDPTLNEFISWLQALKADSDDVSFSSIVCLSQTPLNGIPCNSPWGYPDVGARYMPLVESYGIFESQTGSQFLVSLASRQQG